LILAAYELLHLPEMPPKVTIDEAVSLAKRFGSADSGKFVNGVLGSLLKATPKQSWQPHAGESVFDEQEEPIEEPEVEVIEEGTPLHDEVVKAGAWTIRARPGAN
jgi:N utilization substance protein B